MGNIEKSIEIACPLHGIIACTALESKIIDTPVMHRLRRIHQLGLLHYVFPGATHNRFSHSLGTMHLAGKLFESIVRNTNREYKNHFTKHGGRWFSEEDYHYCLQVVRLAGLLHDCGHGPLSHYYEPFLPALKHIPVPDRWCYKDALPFANNRQAKHEDCSIALIYYLAKYELLEEDLAQDVAALINSMVRPSLRIERLSVPNDFCPFRLMQQIISGDIDADRMDYLPRDALFSGVPMGNIDSERLIHSLLAVPSADGAIIALRRDSIYSFENFIITRLHMHLQVYYHRASRILVSFFSRAYAKQPSIFDLTDDKSKFIEEYLELDDAEFLKKIKNNADEWCQRITNHDLFLAVDVPDGAEQPENWSKLAIELDNKFGQGIIIDQKTIALIKPLLANSKQSYDNHQMLRVYYHQDHHKPIADASKLVGHYQAPVVINRIYCKPELHNDVSSFIAKHFA